MVSLRLSSVRARALWLCTLAMMLGGCGGGGGGGSSGSGGSGPATSSVTVGAPSVRSLSYQALPNATMQDASLTGTLSGDVESLNGRSIYVTVEDPAKLFESTAQLIVVRENTGWSYRLDLRGAPLKQAGKFTGDLVIRACLDANCLQPLGGTPVRVAYDVDVMALSLGSKELEVTVPFGTLASHQRVVVNKPAVTNEWNVNIALTDAEPQYGMLALDVDGRLDSYRASSAGYVDVVFLPVRVGRHNAKLTFNAPMDFSDNRHALQTVELPVRYIVTENPAVDHWFWPAQVKLELAHGDALLKEMSVRAIPGPGVTLTKLRNDYLTFPGSRGEWLNHNGQYSGCIVRNWDELDCMARGEYRVNMVYRLTGPSGSREVFVPVTLTVR